MDIPPILNYGEYPQPSSISSPQNVPTCTLESYSKPKDPGCVIRKMIGRAFQYVEKPFLFFPGAFG